MGTMRPWFVMSVLLLGMMTPWISECSPFLPEETAVRGHPYIISSRMGASSKLCQLKITHSKKTVVCYMTAWAITRPNEGRFSVIDADTEHCTHLIYAFMGLDDQHQIKSIDADIDSQQLGKLKGLRKINPGIKVLVSIGGYNEKGGKFSDIARDPEKRSKFIESVLEFLERYELNGIDICWQFPGQRGGRPDDKKYAVDLFQAIKDAFDSHHYLLTVHILGKRYIIDEYDIPAISEIVDFINFPAVEYSGPWERTTGAMAPLRSKNQQNVQFAVDYLLKKGAPPEKVLLGLPLYGHAYILEETPKEDHLIGLFSNKTFPGPWTNEFGITAFVETCHKFKYVPGWKEVWDEESSTPLAFKDIYFISFDNQKSLLLKAELVHSRKLGGVMFWSLDMEDFKGLCFGKPYPLISAVSDYINRNQTEAKDGSGEPLSLASGEEPPSKEGSLPQTEPNLPQTNPQEEITEPNKNDEVTTAKSPEIPLPGDKENSESSQPQTTEKSIEAGEDKIEPNLLNSNSETSPPTVETSQGNSQGTSDNYIPDKPEESTIVSNKPPLIPTTNPEQTNRPIIYTEEQPYRPPGPYQPTVSNSNQQQPYRPPERPIVYQEQTDRPYGPHRPLSNPQQPNRPYEPEKPYGPYRPTSNPQIPGRPFAPDRPYGPYRPTSSNPQQPDRPYESEKPYGPLRPIANPQQPDGPYGPYRPISNPQQPDRPYGPYGPMSNPQQPDRPYGPYRPVSNPQQPNSPYEPERPYEPYKPTGNPQEPIVPPERPYYEGSYNTNQQQAPNRPYVPSDSQYEPYRPMYNQGQANNGPYQPHRPIVNQQQPSEILVFEKPYEPYRPIDRTDESPQDPDRPIFSPTYQYRPPSMNPATYWIFIVKKSP